MNPKSSDGAAVRCRTCGRSWPASYKLCPEDGGDLAPTTTFAGAGAADLTEVVPYAGSLTEVAPYAGSLTEVAPHAGSLTEVTPYVGSRPGRAPLGSPSALAALPNEGGAFGRLATAPTAAHALVTGQSDELAPGTPVSEYLVEKKIGEGAMGAVYTARHPTIGKLVAIKIMTPRLSREPEAVERFVGEARAVAAIRHPGIVDVFGFGSLADGRLYLVMELLHGESLRDCLERGRLGLSEALELLDQMARALEAAHDDGIIHRDLKPENVFLVRVAKDPRPLVKILDFGLAKLIDGNDGRVRRTQSGQLIGTPLYMSPEQCKAKGVDHRTDIYALGCIAYELFCGRVPFDFDNIAELIAAHLSEDPPAPRGLWPEIPPALDGIVFAMLAKTPAQRPTLEQIRQTISTMRAMPIVPSQWPTVPSRLPTPIPDEWQTSVPGNVPTLVPAAKVSAPTAGLSGPRPPGAAARTTLGSSTAELQASPPPQSRAKLVIAGAIGSVAVVALLVAITITRDRRVAGEPVAHDPEVGVSTPPASRTAASPTTPPQSSDPSFATTTMQASGSAAIAPKVASQSDNKPSSTSPPVGTVQIKAVKPHVEKAIDKAAGKLKAVPEVSIAPETAIGTLTLDSTPPCNIYIDGKSLRLRTPQPAIQLPAGRHQIMLVNAEFKITDSFLVEIKPGLIEKAFKHYEPKTDSATTINPWGVDLILSSVEEIRNAA